MNEDEYKEEEDIGHLQDGAISIASNVIADVFESSHLSDLEYITCGGYNHVWLVVYSTVCDLAFVLSFCHSFVRVLGLIFFQDRSQGGS